MSYKNYLKILILLCLGVCFVGCANMPIPGQGSITSIAPDYYTPESAFIEADFNKLATEFMDVYSGQYIVFDGNYTSHTQGALLYTASGAPIAVTNLMSMDIYKTDPSDPYKGYGRSVKVIWALQDKELALPLLSLKIQDKVKIYGYVVPANKIWRNKTEPIKRFKAFSRPVIVLIRAVPLN